MGTKAKKAMKKNMKRASSNKPSEGADFLPLEGGPARKFAEQKPPENTSAVLHVSRIPHGFYEKEMEGYFGQFGTIKRLRIARNKKGNVLQKYRENVQSKWKRALRVDMREQVTSH